MLLIKAWRLYTIGKYHLDLATYRFHRLFKFNYWNTNNILHCFTQFSLVLPENPITNYLTQFSGITKSTLEGVTKRLTDVQDDLRKLLPRDAILVGQSLNSDLHALKMMHPYVIDTSVIYNVTGNRSRKTKLSVLSHMFLGQDIQKEGRRGHDPEEDARAAM